MNFKKMPKLTFDKTLKTKKEDVKPLTRFTPKKEKKEKSEKGNSDFWLKIAKHKAEIALRVVIVLVVLTLATLFFYIRYLNKVYSTYEVVNSQEVSISMGTEVLRYGTHFLIYGSDGAKCMDGKGNIVWNETYEMQNPMVDICGDVIGIADYNGSAIHMMNSTGVLGTIETGMPIRDFRVSEKRLALVVLDDSSTTPIYVYNSEGEQKAFFSTSMRNSGYPLGICISNSGYLVGISYLYVDSGSFKTDVAFYNFGEVGQNETDNLVSGYSYANAVVPEIKFIGDSKAIALADNRLMFYSGNQKPTSTVEVLVQNEIYATYYSDEYVVLVFLNTQGETKYRMEIYDGNGKIKDTLEFDQDYKEIFFDEDRVIIYNSESCLIHKVGGIDKFEGTFDRAVLTMMPTNVSNRFVIVTNESIDTIELK